MTDADRIRLLSPRERQVLSLVLRGAGTMEQIGAELGISVRTVKTYLQRIFAAFGVRSQTALMARLMVPRVEVEMDNG
jgi:DNA-binding CsgD family transcriptional regulator